MASWGGLLLSGTIRPSLVLKQWDAMPRVTGSLKLGAAILHNDLADRPRVKSHTSGRVVLLGDAPHPTTPNLGQGANMAIDDALARALRDEPSHESALVRYERDGLARTRQIVERGWNFGEMCLWSSAPAVWMRERMMRLTPTGALRGMLRSQILESSASCRAYPCQLRFEITMRWTSLVPPPISRIFAPVRCRSMLNSRVYP